MFIYNFKNNYSNIAFDLNKKKEGRHDIHKKVIFSLNCLIIYFLLIEVSTKTGWKTASMRVADVFRSL